MIEFFQKDYVELQCMNYDQSNVALFIVGYMYASCHVVYT